MYRSLLRMNLSETLTGFWVSLTGLATVEYLSSNSLWRSQALILYGFDDRGLLRRLTAPDLSLMETTKPKIKQALYFWYVEKMFSFHLSRIVINVWFRLFVFVHVKRKVNLNKKSLWEELRPFDVHSSF